MGWSNYSIFLMENSSAPKSESHELLGPGGIHVENQAYINNDTICMGEKSYINTVYVVEFDPYLYYEYVKPASVDLAQKWRKNTDDDSICDNPLLSVTHKLWCT